MKEEHKMNSENSNTEGNGNNNCKKVRLPETEDLVYTKRYRIYVELCIVKANISHFDHSDNKYRELMEKVADDTPDEKTGKKHYININTWKKMNNDLRSKPNYVPSKTTLSQIADYLGCDSWEELEDNYERVLNYVKGPKTPRTGIIGGALRRKSVLADIVPGDYIRVYYEPDRAMQAKYLGASKFEITGLHNIPTLDKGDRFWAFDFVVGDQFRLVKIVHQGLTYPQGFSSHKDHHITKVIIDKAER